MPHTARITPGDYAYHVLNRRAGRTALFNDEGTVPLSPSETAPQSDAHVRLEKS